MCPYFLLAKQFKKISISVLEYIQVFAFYMTYSKKVILQFNLRKCNYMDNSV